eukprot:TRINITY_DN50286_c0_g1_i1.p1 TRINITY_DN50286_c0_g1~~TRINITY_DN50286_c0_g1_i1.p1  ORF type:complete len:134 (+),score=35.31 TRINITY_DN50286_c0_g1_i1:188-589(+)
MKVTCLLIFLSVAVVYQAEAGWWGKTTRWVVGAVRAVVGFYGKKDRKRRELREVLDVETMKGVDKLCTKQHITALTPDGVPFEVIKDIFEFVDKGNGEGQGKDALNEQQVDAFVDSLEVFKYCMTKGDKDKTP